MNAQAGTPAGEAEPTLTAPTLLAGAGASGDFARDVHVSRGASLRGRLQRRAWMRRERITPRVRVLQPPAVVAIGLFMVLGGALGNVAASVWGLRSGWVELGGALLGVPTGLLLWRALRRVRSSGRVARVAPAADDRYRLRVLGGAPQIGAIDALSDDPFEPQVYFVPFSIPSSPVLPIAAWIGLTACTVALLALLRRQGLLPQAAGAGPIAAWDVWACMAVAVMPFYALFPTYYRIAPGRLDVFRYRVLGLGRPRVETIDLRRARVAVDVTHSHMVIEPEGRDDRLLFAVGPWGGRMPEIARYLLQAARWRHDTPSLSTDSLTG